MPQARSSGSKPASSYAALSTARSARTAARSKSTARQEARRGRPRPRRSTARKPRAARATGSASSGSAGTRRRTAPPPPTRGSRPWPSAIRKLNERIIEEGKSAGEATLSSYEKALKAIASSLERGPGKSDVEWISSLATTQAKFIRDVTTAWTAAARGVLK